jgi:hypothetical protein
VDVLNAMIEAVEPGGLALDLHVIRPNPVVEVAGRVVCEVDGTSLFRTADAAVDAIDALIARGRLAETAGDDHDVLKHYGTGADLVDDFAGKQRNVPERAIPILRSVERACTVRERCRLRRLHVLADAGAAATAGR